MSEFFDTARAIFGTDVPLGPPAPVEATIAELEAARLSEEDRAPVYAGNAMRLRRRQAIDR